MSRFDITPSELAGMIGRLQSFQSSLGTIASQMLSYASQLGATWKDPQYQQFQLQIKSMGQQLKGNQELMLQMARQLKTLKENLEKTQQDFHRQRR